MLMVIIIDDYEDGMTKIKYLILTNRLMGQAIIYTNQQLFHTIWFMLELFQSCPTFNLS